MRPQEVPVDRLVKAAERAVAKNPKSAEVHYTLARIHYLAFMRGTETLAGFPGRGPNDDRVAPDWMVGNWIANARSAKACELALDDVKETDRFNLPPEKRSSFQQAMARHEKELERANWHPPVTQGATERIQHALTALAEFHAAERLDPRYALAVLGEASLVEQVVDWNVADRPGSLPKELATLDYEDARKLFRQAYTMAFADDAAHKNRPVEGLGGFVSYEAGEAFLRLSERKTPADEAERKEIQAGLARLEKIPWGAVTPIVLSLETTPTIDALLAPERSTDFRLRGYGFEGESWPWVKGTTGLLVWDPQKRGEITSGQQLFGSYTFQIFRANGYEALAALDDDRDGILRGAELGGIRVWFDANGDGRSAPDEVRDLDELGIVAIDTRTDGSDGIHPTNPRGILLRDGRSLRTWDWIVSPLSR